MASSDEHRAFILARQLAETTGATVRTADAAGPAAASDPRLREQLDALHGLRLSQYSIGSGGVRLSFWGEKIAAPGREILIEEETIQITQRGQQARTVPGRSEATAIALLNTLDQRLSAIQISQGRLQLAFDNGFRLEAGPHQQWEAWQISSDDHLLIVCTPGGELTVWYPDQTD
jgi:Family of unknown function (DUF6188)